MFVELLHFDSGQGVNRERFQSPLGNRPMILSQLEIECEKLHFKTIPTMAFLSCRFSIHIGILIEIFTPTEGKSSTGALRQGCLDIAEIGIKFSICCCFELKNF